MHRFLPEKLKILADNCPKPLYVVGGFVRDFFIGKKEGSTDVDLCAPLSADEFLACAEKTGFHAVAVYRNTGTVKIKGEDGEEYEFTSFRSDEYVRGKHTPERIFFTEEIEKDARRRDFTMNAVYYDVKNKSFVDPLGGIEDIKHRKIRTVDNPQKVFGEDGLRLMRLARQSGQTGFQPTHDCKQAAKDNANLIEDISKERIFTELCLCLHADEKYGNKNGHYEAFKLLEETEVLAHIFPDLWLGKGMKQRADFHRYDVLEHSLRALLYAHPSVRLSALLHDVAKPICTIRYGNSHQHNEEGETLARKILGSLKAPKKVIEETAELVRYHMYDFDGKTKENKLRRFLVEHHSILPKLLLLKQADYSACKDDPSPCPTLLRWEKLLSKMRQEKVPFTLKELKVKGDDILLLGCEKREISSILHSLLLLCSTQPEENEKERLLKRARAFIQK